MVDVSGPFPLALSNPVICIVGPTASGKTAVAQMVAERYGGEVISADSMQVYRGMDIGTGKIAPAERIVPHHGLDLVDPGQPYSAALFQSYARRLFSEIDASGKVSVLAGGTGLYVRAAIDDYSFPSGEQLPEDNPVRVKYASFAQEHGAQALWDLLFDRDPDSARLIHPNNVKRVVRAFELLEIDGTSYASKHAGFETMRQFVPAVIFHLDVDPALLSRRIDARVDSMVEQGLLDEVRLLVDQGFKEALTAKEAIGYKEFVPCISAPSISAEDVEEAKALVKSSTRRYAKRQRTWWRNDDRVVHVPADSGDPIAIARIIGTHLDGLGFRASDQSCLTRDANNGG